MPLLSPPPFRRRCRFVEEEAELSGDDHEGDEEEGEDEGSDLEGFIAAEGDTPSTAGGTDDGR